MIKEIYIDKDADLIGLDIIYGKNILLLPSEKIKKTLLLKNPKIKQITIEKSFPNKIFIRVNKRMPLAYLKADAGFFKVDEQAVVLERLRKKEKNLPVINFYQPLSYSSFSPGSNIDFTEIKKTLRFLFESQNLNLKVNSIDILAEDMIRLVIDKQSLAKEIFISTRKPVENQIYELRKIMEFLQRSGIEEVEYIDLRFEKPIYKK